MGKSLRRRLGYDSSDEGRSDPISTCDDPNSVKTRLQIDDLGNRARDRQTAHDLENDRNVDATILNAIRKSNQRGTVESKQAEKNQDQLQKWAGFGGIDSTTNLDDIAGGQYHRAATIEKIQVETRKLRARGVEVNAEAVDNPKAYPKRGADSEFKIRGHARMSMPVGTESSTRPLDPAIDPNRAYTYKTKGRGKQKNNLRAVSPLKRQRLQNYLATNDTPISSRTRSGGNIGVRPIRQRTGPEIQWAPAALMANPEPPKIGLATEAPAPSVDQLKPESEIPKNTLSSPERVKASSVSDDHERKPVAAVGAPLSSPEDSGASREVVEFPKGHTQNISSLNGNTTSRKDPNQIAESNLKPELFLEFMHRKTPLKQFNSGQLTPERMHSPKSHIDMKANLQAWSKVLETKPGLDTASNEMPSSSTPTSNEDARDSLTDGRLTPIPLSDVLNDASTDAGDSTKTDLYEDKAASISNSICKTITSDPGSTDMRHLLDADIPTVDHGTLRPNDPPSIRSFGGHYYIRLPDGWKPGTQISHGMFSAFKDRLRKLGVLEEADPPTTEVISPVVGASNLSLVSPPLDSSANLADERVLGEKITDSTNPEFRPNVTSLLPQGEESKTRKTADGDHGNHKSLSSSKLLQSRSTNLSPQKSSSISKWAQQQPGPGQSIAMAPCSRQKSIRNQMEARDSLLGDRSTRPVGSNSKISIEESKHAFEATGQPGFPRHAATKKYIPAGPGFHQLRKNLVERGFLNNLSQPHNAATSATVAIASSDVDSLDRLFSYRDRRYSTSDESEL